MAGIDFKKILKVPWRWFKDQKWQLYQGKLLRSGWYDSSARSHAKAILIGGCPRTGTTLLREMLGRHSKISIGPETSMLVPGFDPSRIADFWRIDPKLLNRRIDASSNLVEFAATFYQEIVAKEGTERWIDKASANVRNIAQLLAWFPQASFVHVIRDGRDVVCSLRTHPTQILKRGNVRTIKTSRSIDVCAAIWLYETSAGLAFRGHPRYFEVQYEQLVADPENTIRTLCHSVGEDFEQAMLIPKDDPQSGNMATRLLCNANAATAISRSSVGRWQHDLSIDEQQQFANVAGELLVALGYANDQSWIGGSAPATGSTPECDPASL